MRVWSKDPSKGLEQKIQSKDPEQGLDRVGSLSLRS
jgi:hypothetical protein